MVEAIRDFELGIDKDEVCRFLGYRKDRGPNGSISVMIDSEIGEAYNLIQPSCFYQLKDIKRVRQSQVILENDLTIDSAMLSRIFRHCHRVAIFLATIGPRLEHRVAELMEEGQIVRAMVLDASGSEAAERVACHVQERISELAAADGDAISLRYSPGYCDWDISQQRVLFEVMDSTQTGVTLSNECLMTPLKSVSGIIGLGESETYQLGLSACLSCTTQDCPNRR